MTGTGGGTTTETTGGASGASLLCPPLCAPAGCRACLPCAVRGCPSLLSSRAAALAVGQLTLTSALLLYLQPVKAPS